MEIKMNEDVRHYGRGTHGYCVRCTPPRKIFFETAKAYEGASGETLVELECKFHGPFRLSEVALEILGTQQQGGGSSK